MSVKVLLLTGANKKAWHALGGASILVQKVFSELARLQSRGDGRLSHTCSSLGHAVMMLVRR